MSSEKQLRNQANELRKEAKKVKSEVRKSRVKKVLVRGAVTTAVAATTGIVIL